MFGVAPAVAGAVDSTSQSLGGGASVPSEDALAVANAFGKQFTLLKKKSYVTCLRRVLLVFGLNTGVANATISWCEKKRKKQQQKNTLKQSNNKAH